MIATSGLFVFISVVLASYLLVYGLRQWAIRKNILDIPNQRSSHSTPIPRGGGFAISILVIVIGILAILFGQVQSISSALVYLGCAATIAVLGFVDDLYKLPAKVRFGIQGAVAIITTI